MHARQAEINERWSLEGLPVFGLGLGLSTGEVAAALLGSEERLEYTLVGDTVNLSQRLQQFADAGETVLSEATYLRALRARRHRRARRAAREGTRDARRRVQDRRDRQFVGADGARDHASILQSAYQ